ncbi:adenylosuccinate synthase [Candidatus Poribacteria bacterium]|jgi:adenylosuccinate synthase|nr:adenylosuccinate synthase [Candidatus Poribacteria bacterium]MBT5536832.1 adenylosuccinate synthase [Candidatus Poribacteria bacterium]MBT5713599.1 adenylosuccinate synthase [Candidatus Poribacteria bacterium]MBT7808696.1 adenylosuccinate synthase [Candidatus Poribacteria bacterium]
MRNTFVVGSQWGDESKGKSVDLLASKADVVARGAGGPNAGHTIIVGKEKHVFHLLPSGMLHSHCVNIIGNGVVIGVEGLLKEMDDHAARGFDVGANLLISDRAHLILPHHLASENLDEDDDKWKLGTTRTGVGPAYTDKAARVSAVRMGDLMEFDGFTEKLTRALSRYGGSLSARGETIDLDDILARYKVYAERLRPHVTDTSLVLHEAISGGKSVVFEGAQGALLDVDHGTYPYVTSSNTTVGGICTGLGIPPTAVQEVLAVVKAYTTRVGLGPFPTEMDTEFGERVRQIGKEFGATTGRPRRCGWLDVVGLRYASRINGFTQIALSKMDVLDTLPTIQVCVGYSLDGVEVDNFPAQLTTLSRCEPIYEQLPGWEADTTMVRTYEDLPTNARKYVERVEELLGTPVALISVGPERTESIVRAL